MTDKEKSGKPVSGLSFEQLSKHDIQKVNAMFSLLGGFNIINFINEYGYIGINGELLKIDYVTYQDDKIIFEPIRK